MENRFNDLFIRFQTKGFKPVEIPWLIKDVMKAANNDGYFTIADINHELEELGWGIRIIDNVTYELINTLVPKTIANILVTDDA